jgi:Sulfatase
MYYSTGCAHAPHHVARAWADKYKGAFDGGWDQLREQTFERQKRLGIVPEGTELTGRPDLFPAWDSLAGTEKKLYARQMEVFAGYCENADWNVGRLLDAVEEMGDLDNTLIFYIWGDNGSSMEGTVTGSFNEMTFLNGVVLDAGQQLQLIEAYGGIDAIGGEHTAPHYAAAWAHAGNRRSTGSARSRWTVPASPTPLATRRRPSGTRCSTSRCSAAAPCTPMAGGRAPSRTRRPGTSPRRRSAGSPRACTTRKTTSGSCTTCPMTSPRPATWPRSTRASSPSSRSCGGPRPSATGRCRCSAGCPSSSACCRRCPRSPGTPSPGTCRTSSAAWCPRVYGRSYAIEAELEVPDGGAEGVIVANADFIGGFGLWVDSAGMLNYTYSFLGVETYKQVSTEQIPAGPVTVKLLFEADKPEPGTGGAVTLWANGKLVGEGKMPHTVPVAFSSYAGMDIGRDNGLVVDRAYEDKAPYAFTGTVKRSCSTSSPPPTKTSRPSTYTPRSRPSARGPPAEDRRNGGSGSDAMTR